MESGNPNEGRGHTGTALASLASDIDRERRGDDLSPTDGRPRLRVRVIERTALIRLEDAEFLFDEEVIRELGQQLDRLVKDDGHSRLLINLGGVRYLSSAMLARLAWLGRRVQPIDGQIQLCGLDPLLRDMVRIAHLGRVLDVCDDEATALGLIIH
jgi:anti-anti-sigma factor